MCNAVLIYHHHRYGIYMWYIHMYCTVVSLNERQEITHVTTVHPCNRIDIDAAVQQLNNIILLSSSHALCVCLGCHVLEEKSPRNIGSVC